VRLRAAVVRLAVIAVVLSAVASAAAQTAPLSVEWVVGQGSEVARVPTTFWLTDGSAIIYDGRRPAAQRVFERFDPASGQRQPLFDMARALTSLKAVAKDADVKEALSWPAAMDRGGRSAAWVFNGDLYLLDFASSSFSRLTNTPAEKCVQFSPDGRLLSFVRDNDIYAYDLAGKKELRLTRDGSETTLNGTLSWVYWEEILGRRDSGYWWSPDSRAIAYLQTDESQVPMSTFVDFAPVNPRLIKQRYPKAGENNPRVRVGVVELDTADTRWVSITDKPYEWIIRLKWLPDSKQVSVETLDRPQTELGLYFAHRKSGAARRILTETDRGWVNITDDLHFIDKGRQFLWASERDGFMHLYRYAIDGTLLNQVTKGEWATA
jgi:dipeptidyl-peptidase-4